MTTLRTDGYKFIILRRENEENSFVYYTEEKNVEQDKNKEGI